MTEEKKKVTLEQKLFDALEQYYRRPPTYIKWFLEDEELTLKRLCEEVHQIAHDDDWREALEIILNIVYYDTELTNKDQGRFIDMIDDTEAHSS